MLNPIHEKKFFQKNDVCLINNTGIKKFFLDIKKQYDLLKKRNAFLDNYLKFFPSENGLEVFDDAHETIENLISEYKIAEIASFY